MNPTVMTIGHSYIRRLMQFCKQNNLQVNFNIPWINGIMFGKGGARLENIQQGDVNRLIEMNSSEVVLLQIGGNDIDSNLFNYIKRFIVRLEKFLRDLMDKGVKQIVLMKLFHRDRCRVSPATYRARRALLNLAFKLLTKKAEFQQNVVVWNLKRCMLRKYLGSDRIHLSQNRMKSYFYDLKRTALHALKRI